MKFCECLRIQKLAPHMQKSFYANLVQYFAQTKGSNIVSKGGETLQKDIQ
jgi:hypothetical protein